MNRGTVVWVDLSDAHPPEMGKQRPAVVVSNSTQNTVLCMKLSHSFFLSAFEFSAISHLIFSLEVLSKSMHKTIFELSIVSFILI